MPVQLYLAPAAAGKTRYLIEQVRQVTTDLTQTVRVCVPGSLQAQAWRRRLAESGGALGVRVQLFHELYAECLDSSGQTYIELSEPVQYRLLQAIINEAPLKHYHALKNSPGFIHLLQDLIAELKAARISSEQFSRAIAQLGNEARLSELAAIYAAYQDRLRQQDWTDRAGLGWLAVEALANQPVPAFCQTHLFVDGFDNFTTVQIDFLRALAQQTGQVVITLTGTAEGQARPVHRRFNQTCERLETLLQVKAAPLPAQPVHPNPVLAHLEAQLREPWTEAVSGAGVVTLIEAPDRVAEVRSALRWLKTRLVQDELRPNEVALLARSLEPYRSFIVQIGAEFGLPLRLMDGQPLRSNPAVAALLDLLRLMLPAAPDRPEPILPYRLVVEAWRSPYFDWSHAAGPDGIEPRDAQLLDRVARYGRVLSGYQQWLEAFIPLIRQDPLAQAAGLADAAAAQRLLAKFQGFVARLTPPPAASRYRDFVRWLEELIGAPASASPEPASPPSLDLVARACAAPATAERDLAALQSLKEVLRGLVWAEAALQSDRPVSFAQFWADLAGAIEISRYMLPVDSRGETILVADAVQARGIPFQAVAVLGLAEGEFPAVLTEDPLLRDADRRRLNGLGLLLNPSTESSETEFFYETITRPWGQLLLTRPRLADNGAPLKASPFWEEVERLVEVEPLRLTRESAPPPDRVASWVELMESLSSYPGYEPVRNWVKQVDPARQETLELAAQLLQLRRSGAAGSPFEGALYDLAPGLQAQFASTQPWSASRLEDYRTCPFLFFAKHVLKLEPQAEPDEGLDAQQLGKIYHRIFEQLYKKAQDPADVAELLDKLPRIADPILDEAPEKDGFRVTAWWAHTRAAIVETVRASVVKLAELPGEFVPIQYEARFADNTVLMISDGDDRFCLRGIIDRVDRAPDGALRIIDYKTSSPAGFHPKPFQEGKKLQLPLYALAARDALGLGEPVEGFYWHVRHAEPSSFSLKSFSYEDESGPAVAIRLAVEKAWEAVRGARAGHFTPEPPRDGCPTYCPAANICWHYQPRFGG